MSKKYGQPEYEVPDNKTERGRNMQRGQGYGMNSIFHRISVRKYQNRDVEQVKIELMLKAAWRSVRVQSAAVGILCGEGQGGDRAAVRGFALCKMCEGRAGRVCAVLPVQGDCAEIF